MMVDVYDIWLNHGLLKHRAVLKLKFKPDSPIHIGSGAKGEVLQYALMLKKGEILIPASTWKGVFRRITEILAKSVSVKPAAFSNYEYEVLMAHEEKEKITHYKAFHIVEDCLKNMAKTYGAEALKTFLLNTVFPDERELEEAVDVRTGVIKKKKSRDVQEKLDFITQLLCSTCRLYGAPSLKGKLVFTDTIIPPNKYISRFRTHVGINRKSGTSEERALYSLQLIMPEEVELEIIVNNVKPKTADALLWAATLDYILKEGISLGMRKSIGLGILKVKKEESKVYVNELETLGPEDLLKTLADYKHKAETLTLEKYVKYLKGT